MAKRTKKTDIKVVVKPEQQGSAKDPERKEVVDLYLQNSGNTKNFQRWWAVKDKDKLFSSVISTVDTIEASNTPHRLQMLNNTRMYGNYQMLGFNHSMNGTNAAYGRSGYGNSSKRPIFNVVQSCIDSITAKIAKDQPKITVVTNGASDFRKRKKAEKLTKFINALMKHSGVYENSEEVFRSAGILGNSYMKFYREDGQIKSEFVSAHEIVVDYADGMMKSNPRSMHQIKIVPRDSLLIAYRDDADKCQKIMSCASGLHGQILSQSTVDMIEVIESWHLPTNDKSNDGVHCIVTENCTLFHEEYKKDFFPINAWRWMPNTLSFFGRSIVEELADKQMEITKLMMQIGQSIELCAVPIIMVPNEAKVARDHLASNYIARIIKYNGNQPPTFQTPTAQNPEVYNYLNSLISWCYRQIGLSETTASGQKPAGVTSGTAIREVADIESGRYSTVSLRWENLFKEHFKVILDLCREEAKENPEFLVKYTENKTAYDLKFLDVDLEDKDCVVYSAFPTNQLPDTPEGRIQTITEYIQNQWISKERGMELLNLDPDLESEVDMQTASLQIIEKWLSQMAEDGIYNHPEPLNNVQLALSTSMNFYNMLLSQECPEENLQLVRNFITECQTLLQPPAPPRPPPGPMAPSGAPGPQGTQGMAPMPNPQTQMVPMTQG
jgi:hypothetical protein